MNVNYLDSMIVQHYSGSHAYGTNLPTSDVDIRGIFVAPEINIRTPFFPVREINVQDEEDTKYYELTNFFKLYLDMHPNILETMWVDDTSILYKNEVYDFLVQHRNTFLTSRVAFTFSGYALAQLKKIKNRDKYLNKPQLPEPPKQIDFVKLIHNFQDTKMLDYDPYKYHKDHRLIHYGADIYGLYAAKGYETFDLQFTLNTRCDDLQDFYLKEPSTIERIIGLCTSNSDYGKRKLPLALIKFNTEQYKAAHQEWHAYWEWKANRNESRHELEKDFGFDTKNGMHLVRLLRMGEEILTDGIVQVKRNDFQDLLDIRAGKWTYEEITEYAQEKDEYIRNVLYKRTSLPKVPDYKVAAKVLMEAQDIQWELMKAKR